MGNYRFNVYTIRNGKNTITVAGEDKDLSKIKIAIEENNKRPKEPRDLDEKVSIYKLKDGTTFCGTRTEFIKFKNAYEGGKVKI